MKDSEKHPRRERISLILLVAIVVGGFIYYDIFQTPRNSLELYQDISFADDFEDAQKLMLDGYEENFSEEDFNYINDLETSAETVSQFTLLQYNDRSFVIMTSPGTEKLHVLKVEELPEEIRDYFLELHDSP